MPLPTTYSIDEFKAFLIRRAPEMSALLGWTVDSETLDEVVNDTLFALKLSDFTSIDTAAEVEKLRAMGMVCYWRAAIFALTTRYDFADAGGQISRNQLLRNAQTALSEANGRATDLGLNTNVPEVHVSSMKPALDPYDEQTSSIYGFRLPRDRA